MHTPFNPLDIQNLAKSLGYALVSSPVVRLDEVPAFPGSGIYAIYYTGSFPLYSDVSKFNQGQHIQAPIYIGKAVPRGARKGGFSSTDERDRSLHSRLVRDHAKSISQVENLLLTDFYVRWLILDQIWIPLGESVLIDWFRPLWNQHIDGFGNHDPGRGRHNGKKSRWDTLHPGRPWANHLQPNDEPAERIMSSMAPQLVHYKRHLRETLSDRGLGYFTVSPEIRST